MKKNIVIFDEILSDKLTVIPNSNGVDYWLITHKENSSIFLLFNITQNGVSKAKTIDIGSSHKIDPPNIGSPYSNFLGGGVGGSIKASPDGKKLAIANRSLRRKNFEIFDFDATNGELSNCQVIDEVSHQNGISFSPDNSKLYLSTMQRIEVSNYIEFIRQYDLSPNQLEEIRNSGKSILATNPATILQKNTRFSYGFIYPDLQIGPDGRIYACTDINSIEGTKNNFLVINKPNLPGFACDVKLVEFNFGQAEVGISNGLPNFIQSTFNNLEPRECQAESECAVVEYTPYPNPTTEVFQVRTDQRCFEPYVISLYTLSAQLLYQDKI